MQCLGPFEPRDAGPRAATATRLPWLAITVTCGVILAIAVVINWREAIDVLRHHALLQAELAVSGGTIVGLLLSRMEGGPVIRKRLAALDALYEQAAAIGRIEPGYTHYLPCVLLMEADASTNLHAELRSKS